MLWGAQSDATFDAHSAATRCPSSEEEGLFSGSKLFEHVVGARHLELAGRLDVELFDDAVVDDHRIALAAGAHAERLAVHRQPDRLRGIAIAVGEHGDRKSTRLNSSH